MKLFRFGAPGRGAARRAAARRRARRRLRLRRATRTRRSSAGATAWPARALGRGRGAARRRASPPASRLAPPVARPSKIVCIGLNYRDHARESGAALPKEPIVFLKATSALAGPRTTCAAPAAATRPTGRSSWRWSSARAPNTSPARTRWRTSRASCCTTTTPSAASSSSAAASGRRARAPTVRPAGPVPGHARRDRPASQRLRLWLKVNGESQQEGTTARHDLRRADAGQLRVAVHDAAARRRHQHGHAGRRRARSQAPALPAGRRRRRIRHRRARPGPAKDPRAE